MNSETPPINYSFVSTKVLDVVEDNGTLTKLAVLVLDETKNKDYWKRIKSFSDVIQNIKLEKSTDAVSWKISVPFINNSPAVHDMVDDNGRSDKGVSEYSIYGIPVDFVDDTDEFCKLELADGRLIDNDYWK